MVSKQMSFLVVILGSKYCVLRMTKTYRFCWWAINVIWTISERCRCPNVKGVLSNGVCPTLKLQPKRVRMLTKYSLTWCVRFDHAKRRILLRPAGALKTSQNGGNSSAYYCRRVQKVIKMQSLNYKRGEKRPAN